MVVCTSLFEAKSVDNINVKIICVGVEPWLCKTSLTYTFVYKNELLGAQYFKRG